MEHTPLASSPRGDSVVAMLRRRWWLIALVVAGAVLVTLAITLSAPPKYRSSLRLQALALDDQEVALYTRRSSGAASEQIALTQFNFNDTLRSSLIAWRTIRDLNLDLSAGDLLANLDTSAAGDFVTVTYDGRSAQEAMDVLNKQVENALAYYNTARSRPASVAGEFLANELSAQNETLKRGQDALLQFQLEHNVGDLPREINAVQDALRTLRSDRDRGEVQASLAETLAGQYQTLAEATAKELADAEKALKDAIAAAPTPDAAQQVDIDALTAQVAALRVRLGEQNDAARAQTVEATGQRALAEATARLMNQRGGDLAQLIGLSSEYNRLQAEVARAQADYDFLSDKAAEARLKQAQAVNVGLLQIVDPAFLPTEPGGSSAVRVALLAALVSLLAAVTLVLVWEFVARGSGRVAG